MADEPRVQRVKRSWWYWVRIGIVVDLVVFGLPVIFAPQILGGVAGLFGYHVRLDSVHVGLHDAIVENVRIAQDGGELVAERVAVRYKPLSVRVERPVMTIVHHADGRWELPFKLPAQSTAKTPSGPARLPNTAADIRLVDARIIIQAPEADHPAARRVTLDHINAAVHYQPEQASQFFADVRSGNDAVHAGGVFDPSIGFASAHITAAKFALANIAGALINRPEFIVDAGELENLDLHLTGAGKPDEVPALHLGGEAQVRNAAFRVVGVAAPVTNVSGKLDFGDGGATSPALRGTIAQTPIVINGGLTNLSAPNVRLHIQTAGRAENLRHTLSVAAAQPLHGPLDVAVRVTGPLASPLILADVQSTGLAINSLELSRPHVLIGLHGDTLTVLESNLSYGPLHAQAAGTARLGANADALFFLHVRGTAGDIDANVLLRDRGGAVALRGNSDAGTIAALGSLESNRTNGSLALVAEGKGGGNRTGVGMVRIQDETIIAGMAANNFRAPDLFGALDGGFAMAKYHNAEWYAANAEVRDPQPGALAAVAPNIPGAAIPARLHVAGNGDPRAFEIERAEADAPAYRVSVTGVAGRERANLTGTINADVGAFTSLAHGRISGPIALINGEGTITAGIPHAEISDGSVSGIPWTSIAGTVRSGKNIQIAATTSLAGGRAILWGDPKGRLGLQAADISLRQVPQAQSSGLRTAGTVDAAGWMNGNQAAAGAVLHDGSVHDLPAGAIAYVQHNAEQTNIRQAAVRLGTAVADFTGALSTAGGAPAYKAHAHMEQAEFGPLLAAFVPATAKYEPQFGISADADISGRGEHPNVKAKIRMPLGSFNGLPLRHGRATVKSEGATLEIARGNIIAGESQFRFAGSSSPGAQHIDIRSPFLNVRELADTASPGSTVSGTGDFNVRATLRGRKLTSDGGFGISDVRVDDVALGNTSGNWRTEGDWIIGRAVGGGSTTRVTVAGRIAPQLTPSFALAPATRIDANAQLRNFDIAERLATFGVHAPLTGVIDADASARGTLRRPNGELQANVHDGTIYGLPLSTAHVSASVTERDVRLRDLQIAAEGLNLQATGIMRGFTVNSPIAVAVRGTSDRLAELIARVTGKKIPLTGSFSSTVSLNGSIAKPAVVGAIALENGKIARIAVPSAVGRFSVSKKALEVSDAEINLGQGSITVGGALPLTLAPFGIGPANAPLALNIGFNEIDLAKLGILEPQEGTLAGQINGAVALEGTASDPRVVGAVRLNKGSVAVKGQPANVDNVNARIRFAGTAATMQANADVGGGRIAMTGHAAVPDLTDVTSLHSDSSVDFRVNADHARFALASLGGGTVDGVLELARAPEMPGALTGDITVSDAAVPLSALLAQQPASTGDGGFIGRTTLALGLHVPKGARVRSGAIDLGATGDVNVGGRISAPTLDGAFVATGGTVTYANRTFRVQRGRVDFDKADGIEPQVDATAVTNIQRSDPSSPGQVAITLEVHGRPNHLSIALSSQPSYSRDQILAMLVGADVLGNLAENSSGGSASSANGSGPSGQGALQNEAVSLLNAQFGQTLLAPITSALGGAVGLSDLGVNVGAGGAFGLTARRNITGNLSVFFEESLGVPARQSVGLDVTPNLSTALQFSVYQERNAVGTGRAASGSAIFTPNRLTPVSASSSTGQTRSGVSLSVQRRLP